MLRISRKENGAGEKYFRWVRRAHDHMSRMWLITLSSVNKGDCLFQIIKQTHLLQITRYLLSVIVLQFEIKIILYIHWEDALSLVSNVNSCSPPPPITCSCSFYSRKPYSTVSYSTKWNDQRTQVFYISLYIRLTFTGFYTRKEQKHAISCKNLSFTHTHTHLTLRRNV